MKLLIGAVVVALGIYWATSKGYIKREWFAGIVAGRSATGSPALDQVISNTNAKLPRMVASDIRFEKVTGNKEEVVFLYRIVDMDYAQAMQKYGPTLRELEAAIVRDVCSDRDVKQYVFSGGHAAQVVLRAQEIKPLLATYIRPTACR